MQWLAIVLIEDSGTENGSPHDLDYIRDYVESMEGDGSLRTISFSLVPVNPAGHIFKSPDAPA